MYGINSLDRLFPVQDVVFQGVPFQTLWAHRVKRGWMQTASDCGVACLTCSLVRQTYLKNMYYVYILHSKKDTGLYIGYTTDLKRRFAEHNNGKSLSTKNRAPFKLIHYEAFSLSSDAKAREKYLKSGYGREQLKSILSNFFKNINK